MALSLSLFPVPQKASAGQDPELDSRSKVEDPGDAYHVNARHLLYPSCSVLRFPVPNEKVPWEVSACADLTHQAAGAQCPGGSGLGPRLAEPTAASKDHEGQMKREARSTRPKGWSWAMNLDTGAAIHTGSTAPLVLKPPSPENNPYPLSECWGGWRWRVRGREGGGLGVCPPQAVSGFPGTSRAVTPPVSARGLLPLESTLAPRPPAWGGSP